MEGTEFCAYQRLQNVVHEFTFLTNTNRTVDDYLDLSIRLADEIPADQPILLLLNFPQDHLPSLAYMMQKARANYRRQPVGERMSIAYLADSTQSYIAENLFPLLASGTQRRFFKRSERDVAIAWLLSRVEADSNSDAQKTTAES